jgi:predicted nuclease of predicted toxin-antitoxin system
VKLLLDQGLPRGAVGELGRRGHDVQHVGEIGMAGATDAEIVERARAEGRTIVTLDADFHALVALSNAATPSVVRLRIEGLRSLELARIVNDVVALCEADLRAGAMVTVDERGVRVRGLPLVRS